MNIARTVYRSQTSKNEIQFSEINYKTTSEFWRIQIFDGEKRNSALNVFTFVLFCANIRKKKIAASNLSHSIRISTNIYHFFFSVSVVSLRFQFGNRFSFSDIHLKTETEKRSSNYLIARNEMQFSVAK